MRKLLPDYWSSRLFPSGHGKIAESLEKYWLEWLEQALLAVNRQAFEAHGLDPVGTLRSLSAGELLALDELFRRNTFYLRPESLRRSTVQIDADNDAITDAYLFVASCARSGVVRERAIMAFARYPGPLAVAAGLIRSTDWVAEVRSVALSLARASIPLVTPPDLPRIVELALRLKDRVRVDQELWQKIIVPKLEASESWDALRSIARRPTGSSLLRRSAFEFLMRGEPASVSRILEDSLAASDPLLGLWALAENDGLPQPEERVRILRAALTARHTAVRSTALRRYGVLQQDDYQQKLRDALFDPTRGVRTIAAFELGRVFGESALAIWRVALEGEDHPKSELAARALCDSGEQQDVEEIAADGVARNSDFRAAILRGLARTKSIHLQSHLDAALNDHSALVIRQVGEICLRGAATLDVSSLEQALLQADDRRAVLLIRLSGALVGKWDRLEFLLRLTSSENTVRAEAAVSLVDSWIQSAARSFIVPADQQVKRLLQLSKDAQARHPEWQRKWQIIDFSLAAFKKVDIGKNR